MTQDADIVLFTGFVDEEKIVDSLLGRYESRIPDARDFALQRRVLLLKVDDAIPFDVSLGGLSYEERMIKRSSMFEFLDGISLRTCSGEDLVILKAFASRDMDWIDLKGVLIRSGSGLQWGLIFKELEKLISLKESPEIMTKLKSLQREIAGI